jgi:hypothetical protein
VQALGGGEWNNKEEKKSEGTIIKGKRKEGR